MKTRMVICCMLLIAATCGVAFSLAQDSASVRSDRPDAFHPGGPIAFTVTLNQQLPKGARFDFRISPLAADEEISLGPGDPVGGSATEFRVSGKLPEGALPGEWHISAIYLFLPGASWTHNTIAPNALRFKVEGAGYAIPSKATVMVRR